MARLGPGYRRLWTSSALSNLADGVFQVALPLLAVRLTRSPTLVAGVATAQRLPWLLFALPAGALADRLDRRTTMLRIDVGRVAVLAALAVAVAAEVATIPVLYVCAFVLGMGETLFDTSAQSIMPSLVDKDRLSEANGRLYAVELTMNQFVGPPLGGVLAGAAIALAFAGSAAAYLLAALALVAMKGSFRPVRTGPPSRLRTDVVEGLRFLWGNRVLRTLGMMTGGFNLASSAMTAVFVLYAVRPGPMRLSESGFGLLLTAAAVGAVLGSWVAAPVERALGRNRMLGLAAVTGAVFNGMPAVTDMVAPMVAASVVGGVGVVLYNVVAVSLRQRITPDRLLGRVNAGYRLLAWGTMPVGAALGGLSAETLGLRPTFALTAVVALALLAGTLVVTDDAIAAAEHDAEREAMTADR